jgi:CheY-like chemotaxis protein
MKWTVLLAADRLDVLQTLPVTLKLAGLKVVVVESGLDAIRQAQSVRPDLIILDPVLPDMDGSTATDILRRLPSTARIPTMLLRPALIPAAEHKGGDSEAPYNRTELLLQIAHVLALCQEIAPPEFADDHATPAFSGAL